jgi:TRAP-type transport system periplasmic protein
MMESLRLGKRNVVLLLVLGLLIVGMGTAFAGGQQEEGQEKSVKLVFGGIQSVEDTATKAMHKMAELAKEKSNGTIELQVNPASQLGNAIQQMEAVSIGSQDMFVDASGFLAQFTPDKNVETLFFTFSTEKHFKAYLESDLNAEMEEDFRTSKGIRIIANNWLRAPRVVASKEPIKGLESFNKLKMRVPEIRGYLESVKALAARPTQIAWGEVYLALMQGVVEACEGPQDSMYTMKFYEPTKNILISNHIRDNLVVMINDKTFNSLSENQQKALVDASVEAGKWYTEQVKSRVDEFFEIMKNEGTNIYTLENSKLEEMQEVMRKAALKLEEQGMWSKGLYKAIQELQ